MVMAPSPVIERIGHEREPVVIIDGFSSDPAALVEQAAGLSYARRGPYYPGIQAPAAPAYLSERTALLNDVLSSVFGVSRGADLMECNYSVVTTPPRALLPIQRLPHFDSTAPETIAVLHYLCGPEDGGTAFYRHRSTGFETVSTARYGDYTDTLQKEVRARGIPQADYMRADASLFEQTCKVEAAFNRLVIYRGWSLHSGAIPPELSFSPDPRKGRLTVNTFLQVR